MSCSITISLSFVQALLLVDLCTHPFAHCGLARASLLLVIFLVQAVALATVGFSLDRHCCPFLGELTLQPVASNSNISLAATSLGNDEPIGSETI